MGTLLRYPYEVRDAGEYFDGIQDVKITKTCWIPVYTSSRSPRCSRPGVVRRPLRIRLGVDD